MMKEITEREAIENIPSSNYLSDRTVYFNNQENWIVFLRASEFGPMRHLLTDEVYLTEFGWQLADPKYNDIFNLLRESRRQLEV